MRLIAEPQLHVPDLDAALAHYNRLGFETVFVHGEPAFYAQVARGGARLNLRHADGPVFAAEFLRSEGDPLAATIATDEVETLHREYEAQGVTFHQPLRTEPWGSRTFIVADPAGNLVLFAG